MKLQQSCPGLKLTCCFQRKRVQSKFMMKFKGIQVNRETTKNISCGKELKMESIIIFGASTAGRACYVLLKDRFKIKFFCDNNEKLVGQSIEGIKIISPDVLKSIEDQYDRIVIASSFYNEIREQLSELGITKPVHRMEINIQNAPPVLNYGTQIEKIREFVEGKRFSDGLRIKYDGVGRFQTRIDVIRQIVNGCNVIHLGCTDHLSLIGHKIANDNWLHKVVTSAANKCIGIDNNKEAVDYVQKLGYKNVLYADILSDSIKEIDTKRWDYLLIAEVLEHLNEPIHFLSCIKKRYANIDKIIVTVPNAFSKNCFEFAQNNVENINTDHRFWFTPYTIIKVLHEAGYITEQLIMCGSENSEGMLERPLMLPNIVVIAK